VLHRLLHCLASPAPGSRTLPLHYMGCGHAHHKLHVPHLALEGRRQAGPGGLSRRQATWWAQAATQLNYLLMIVGAQLTLTHARASRTHAASPKLGPLHPGCRHPAHSQAPLADPHTAAPVRALHIQHHVNHEINADPSSPAAALPKCTRHSTHQPWPAHDAPCGHAPWRSQEPTSPTAVQPQATAHRRLLYTHSTPPSRAACAPRHITSRHAWLPPSPLPTPRAQPAAEEHHCLGGAEGAA
jgi:hypothetical protein